jgi:hypothetical protein
MDIGKMEKIKKMFHQLRELPDGSRVSIVVSASIAFTKHNGEWIREEVHMPEKVSSWDLAPLNPNLLD